MENMNFSVPPKIHNCNLIQYAFEEGANDNKVVNILEPTKRNGRP